MGHANLNTASQSILVVGAPFSRPDGSVLSHGRVYGYALPLSVEGNEPIFTLEGSEANAQFGQSVSLTMVDGTAMLAIGAPASSSESDNNVEIDWGLAGAFFWSSIAFQIN